MASSGYTPVIPFLFPDSCDSINNSSVREAGFGETYLALVCRRIPRHFDVRGDLYVVHAPSFEQCTDRLLCRGLPSRLVTCFPRGVRAVA